VKRFAFKFDPLLMLRKNQRVIRQQLLADVLRHDDELVDRRLRTDAERATQIEELRTLNQSGGDIDVDASASRRHYAVQLAGRMGEIDVERAGLARQIAECRQALVRADQAVKSLENLAERQRTEFIFDQERLEARALEETWQAIHARESEPC
jgi:flagellar export protein FliJ